MELREVFVVGDSLFAETLLEVLGGSENVTVIGTAPTAEEALTLLESQFPDAMIVAVAEENVAATFFDDAHQASIFCFLPNKVRHQNKKINAIICALNSTFLKRIIP